MAALVRLSDEFGEYRTMTREMLEQVESQPPRANDLFEQRLDPHFHDELLPLILAIRRTAEMEFSRGVRNVERSLVRTTLRRQVVTVVSLAVALALGLLVAWSIGRPLGKLTRATEQLAEGRLDTRVDVRTRDEVGKLADSFNRMAASLQSKTVAKERLQASLQEKEVLLKEVHHRVKNNLQIISSLLNLQAQGAPTSEAAKSLRESQGRIHSMSLIHEHLYRSDNLSSIDFSKYVQELAAHLARSTGAASRGVNVRVDVASRPLALDQAIPCGMIVNELVTNAMEHAFPDEGEGEICVGFRSGEAGSELTVSDNGVGFREPKTEVAGWSLGLTVVRALTEQIGGIMQRESNGGTRFSIRFATGLGND
jgi:two-component sensor histidine kinase